MYQPPPDPSTDEYQYESSEERTTPLGIYLLAIVGGIVSLLMFLPALGLMAQGHFLVGLFWCALIVAQIYILIGLVHLKSWAWKWAFVSYGISALIHYALGNTLSAIATLIILIYLSSTVEHYRT